MDDPTNELLYKKKFLQEMFHRVFEWMVIHRDAPLLVGGNGARGRITGSRRFYVHQSSPNVVRSSEDSCVPSVLANGTSALYGITEVIRVDRHLWKHPMKSKTLKQLFHLASQIPAPLSIHRVPKSKKKDFEENIFKWLAQRNHDL